MIFESLSSTLYNTLCRLSREGLIKKTSIFRSPRDFYGRILTANKKSDCDDESVAGKQKACVTKCINEYS